MQMYIIQTYVPNFHVELIPQATENGYQNM
jgi:hypothetical protein